MRAALLLVLAAACSEKHEHAKQLIRSYGCGTCHEIPGVPGAAGTVGPSLDGLANRSFLAGHIANDMPNLVRWVEHPQRAQESRGGPPGAPS